MVRSPTILFVDDDRDFADRVADSLSRTGYAASACYSAEACLARLDDAIEIVVADILLRGITGLELCARIREQYPDILVVITTASQDAKDVVAAMRVGAWDYIIKPVRDAELALTVARAKEHV